jgi:lysophospholipase L1-like esterase
MNRKRILITIIGVLTIVGLTVPIGLIIANQKPPAIYLALGDSLAVGVGASVPENKGYVPQFKQRATANTDLENLAVSGENSSTFISDGQLASAVAAIADPDTDIKVVTIAIGGNDLLALLSPDAPCTIDPTSVDCLQAVQVTLGTFAANYTQIVGTLSAALANDAGEEKFIVTTFYNAYDGTGNPVELTADFALLGADLSIDCGALDNPINTGLNDLITCIGSAAGATGVDVHPLFDGNALDLTHISEGDIHPNDKGHKAIGKALADAVKAD